MRLRLGFTAIVLLWGAGAVQASEADSGQFAAMHGVSASAMSDDELAEVRGQGADIVRTEFVFQVPLSFGPPFGRFVTDSQQTISTPSDISVSVRNITVQLPTETHLVLLGHTLQVVTPGGAHGSPPIP